MALYINGGNLYTGKYGITARIRGTPTFPDWLLTPTMLQCCTTMVGQQLPFVQGVLNGTSATVITATTGSGSVPNSLNNHTGPVGIGGPAGNMRDASATLLSAENFTGAYLPN